MNWLYDDLSAISIGADVSVGPHSIIEVLSKSPKSAVSGRLSLADGVAIGWNANIRAAGGAIRIGKDSILAQNVSLIASNHSIDAAGSYKNLPWDETKTGVEIGDNVWVGAGAIILPGCAIGAGSILGAGSVLTRSIPAGEIWAGVPARRIRAIGSAGNN